MSGVGSGDVGLMEIDWEAGRLRIPSVRPVAVSRLLGSSSLLAASPEVFGAATGKTVITFRAFTSLSAISASPFMCGRASVSCFRTLWSLRCLVG